MTTRLILLRHAKSSWDSPTLSDLDRGLMDRGVTDAQDVGDWMVSSGVTPHLILCSTATRTTETLRLATKNWAIQPTVRFEKDLYLASAPVLLRVVQKADAPDVMVIGHNPGLTDFATMLARMPFAHRRWQDHPTAALTILTFETATSATIGFGTGTVTTFRIPNRTSD